MAAQKTTLEEAIHQLTESIHAFRASQQELASKIDSFDQSFSTSIRDIQIQVAKLERSSTSFHSPLSPPPDSISDKFDGKSEDPFDRCFSGIQPALQEFSEAYLAMEEDESEHDDSEETEVIVDDGFTTVEAPVDVSVLVHPQSTLAPSKAPLIQPLDELKFDESKLKTNLNVENILRLNS